MRRSAAAVEAAFVSAAERFAAWILTGPVGRVAAFFADLGVYWWRWATGRVAGARER